MKQFLVGLALSLLALSAAVSADDEVNKDVPSLIGGIKTFEALKIEPPSTWDNTTKWGRRRQFVLEMALEAWNSYSRYAWRYESLNPFSQQGKDNDRNGWSIISALSTLYVMGLEEQFKRARSFLLTDSLQVNQHNERWLFDLHSSLLSAYALTGDQFFLNIELQFAKVRGRIADMGDINDDNWHYLRDRRLEWQYLSDAIDDQRFINDVKFLENHLNTKDELRNVKHSDGLYLLVKVKSLMMDAPKQTTEQRKAAIRLITNIVDRLEATNRIRTTFTGLTFTSQSRDHDHLMHITNCAYAATLSMLSKLLNDVNQNVNDSETREKAEHYLELAKGIAETCHLGSNSSINGILSQQFKLSDNIKIEVDGWSDHPQNKEKLSEAYFILWRLTGDERYREYAWEYAQALHRFSGTDYGYAEIENVRSIPPNRRDIQRPQLLGATLKYLFLTFSPVSLLPLDQWVFSDGGHPLPVYGRNPAYPFKK